MAKTTLQISIPEPCHEDWSKMTPTQCGAFCNACQKEVVDFSQMSEAEIVERLSKTSGKVCGRMRADKLDRELVKYEPDHAWYSWKKWAVAAGVLLGIGEAKANMPIDSIKTVRQDTMQVKMQDVVVTPGHVWRCGPLSEPTKETPVLAINKAVISGRVIDEQGKPFPLIVVSVVGTGHNAQTNENGEYSIMLSDTFLNKPLQIRVDYSGYEQAENTLIIDNANTANFTLYRSLEIVTWVGSMDVYHPKERKGSSRRKHKN